MVYLKDKVYRNGEFFILHEGPLSITDGVLEEYDYDDLKKKKIKLSSIGGWIGMTDKYWQTAIIPIK